ncbi:MAG TPA: hypothetical protein VGV93_04630 [Acidimicrobiales bacterium]|nr:hypothetical protein [Acidimicrobiales bacterium]
MNPRARGLGVAERSGGGTIIHPDQIIDARELTEGTVGVGTKLTPGQYPLPALLAGQLCRVESAQLWGYWIIRHFMMYFDAFGCFEAAAESWELLPDKLVE